MPPLSTPHDCLPHQVGTSSLSALPLPLPAQPTGVTATLDTARLPRAVLVHLSTGGSLLLELPPQKGGALTLIRAEEGPRGRHVYASTSDDCL